MNPAISTGYLRVDIERLLKRKEKVKSRPRKLTCCSIASLALILPLNQGFPVWTKGNGVSHLVKERDQT